MRNKPVLKKEHPMRLVSPRPVAVSTFRRTVVRDTSHFCHVDLARIEEIPDSICLVEYKSHSVAFHRQPIEKTNGYSETSSGRKAASSIVSILSGRPASSAAPPPPLAVPISSTAGRVSITGIRVRTKFPLNGFPSDSITAIGGLTPGNQRASTLQVWCPHHHQH
ncbi:MAG: hypothetical protein ABI273_10865 [Lacunisphaera sp.]